VAQVQAEPEFTEATRRTQSRAPNERADVLVPFGRTVGTMLFISLPAGIAIAWGNEYPLRDFGIVFFVVNGGAWLLFTGLSEASIWVFERITGKDLDGDKQIGKPPPLRIEYEDRSDGRDREIWADLSPPSKTGYAGVISFARGVVAGESFSERTAADYGYSRTEWKRDMRQVFIDNEWAIWNHPNEERQGVTLLAAGKAVLQRVASEGVPREDWTRE
jgi:hypothetical protein